MGIAAMMGMWEGKWVGRIGRETERRCNGLDTMKNRRERDAEESEEPCICTTITKIKE
jgi:hypothetical protein